MYLNILITINSRYCLKNAILRRLHSDSINTNGETVLVQWNRNHIVFNAICPLTTGSLNWTIDWFLQLFLLWSCLKRGLSESLFKLTLNYTVYVVMVPLREIDFTGRFWSQIAAHNQFCLFSKPRNLWRCVWNLPFSFCFNLYSTGQIFSNYSYKFSIVE